jgi:hypothetical protein
MNGRFGENRSTILLPGCLNNREWQYFHIPEKNDKLKAFDNLLAYLRKMRIFLPVSLDSKNRVIYNRQIL